MAKLECRNCGNAFDKKAIVEYSSAGAIGSRVGVGYTLPVWPLTLRVHAQRSFCKKTDWLRVIPPWDRGLSAGHANSAKT